MRREMQEQPANKNGVLTRFVKGGWIIVLLALLGLTACRPKQDPAAVVVFSESEAFHQDEVSLTVTVEHAPTETYKVYYTLDGSDPAKKGTLLTADGAIALSPAEDGGIRVYPVRALAKFSDGVWSKEAVKTYFVGAEITERFDIQVVSLTVDPEDFYGEKGIYTNYEERGKEWERGCYLELLSATGETEISQHAGVRIHGGWTRARSMKSLRLYARAEYDEEKSSFDYPIFEGATDANGNPVQNCKRFVLRNSGNDFNNTFVRDAFAQTLAKEAGFLETECIAPAAVFINGAYQGFYWIQEYVDDHYFESKFGEFKGTFEKSEHKEHAVDTAEENLEFPELSVLDLTKEENYEKVLKTIDIDNYLTYYAINTLLDNEDWPQTNSISYRYVPANGEAYGEGVFDGRWRFMIHDNDMILGLGSNHPTRECLVNILDPDAVKHHSDTLDLIPYSPLFAALMKRDDVRQMYIDKVVELTEGAFSKENMTGTLNRLTASQENELKHYFAESPHRGNATIEKYREKLAVLRTETVNCQAALKVQIHNLWDYKWR